ncbi:MAG: hypothetical protein OEM97_08735, partial [Acidimicrobiia bacterium]|nr:hypothetical protein [Acidimicrobiia bacterium]
MLSPVAYEKLHQHQPDAASLPQTGTTKRGTHQLDYATEIFAFHVTGRASNGPIEGRINQLGALKRTA